METTKQPKRKDGRYYLLKKIAKLEKELTSAKSEMELAQRVIKKQAKRLAETEDNLAREIKKNKRITEIGIEAQEFIGQRYVWLYEHAPFWVKWQFKKLFNTKKK